ncbi:MAG: hypothetical protein EOO38_03175 [Cytophagaceae bacterium]|nr:MAG: hypothetical protein EOO38_03175 [Cytophagaceae bacterium]
MAELHAARSLNTLQGLPTMAPADWDRLSRWQSIEVAPLRSNATVMFILANAITRDELAGACQMSPKALPTIGCLVALLAAIEGVFGLSPKTQKLMTAISAGSDRSRIRRQRTKRINHVSKKLSTLPRTWASLWQKALLQKH